MKLSNDFVKVVKENKCAWTGGDTPPKDYTDRLFRMVRSVFFRELLQQCGGLDLWKCAGTDSIERARIFWNEATLNAWRTIERNPKTLRHAQQREQFRQLATELADHVAKYVAEEMVKAYDKTTCDERQQVTKGSIVEPSMRLPKVVLCALFPNLENQFGAEAVVPDIKRIRRILKRRM